MIQYAHQQHDIEPFAEPGDVIDGQLAELDLDLADLCGEASLPEIAVTGIEPDDARGPAPLHLDRVEAGVAANVENGHAGQVLRQAGGDVPPQNGRIVTQKVPRRRLHAGQVDVVEPFPQRSDAALDVR